MRDSKLGTLIHRILVAIVRRDWWRHTLCADCGKHLYHHRERVGRTVRHGSSRGVCVCWGCYEK